MEVWALLMRLPSHYQRARSEVFAVVPLWRAALTRWFSVNGTSTTGNTSETTAKDIISARISFAARAVIVPLLDWLLSRVAHDFCNPENPDALGDDSSFRAVTQQQ